MNGDQFHQSDDRTLGGVNASHLFKSHFAGLPMETEIGVQSRYDDIRLDLNDTAQRQFLSPIRSDSVREGSVGLFAQNTLHWTDWLRTNVGWRGDFYDAAVLSYFTPANSGTANAFMGSPKFGVVLGPWARTEFFINAGEGFHSNDARGVTITESPTDGGPAFVAVSHQNEGSRDRIAHKNHSRADQLGQPVPARLASEILFSGDAGDTTASRPSRRYGIEWTNDYRPLSWLSLQADIAVTHARFRGDDPGQTALYASLAGFPAAQIGNAPGNYIPGAPGMIASAGIELGEKTGWFSALRYRYFGPRPLTEDDAFVSPATGLLNGRLGYRFGNGWRVQLDAFNVLNNRSDQITDAYGSSPKSDALFAMCFPSSGAPTAPAAVCQTGVMDRVLHPVEPLAIRLTVAGNFDAGRSGSRRYAAGRDRSDSGSEPALFCAFLLTIPFRKLPNATQGWPNPDHFENCSNFEHSLPKLMTRGKRWSTTARSDWPRGAVWWSKSREEPWRAQAASPRPSRSNPNFRGN